MGIWADGYRYYQDDGYIAFSFGKVNQKENPEWGNSLVDALNKICKRNGEEPKWFLGAPDEEYVFVD